MEEEEEEEWSERGRGGAGFGIPLCPPETTKKPSSSSLSPSCKHFDLVTLIFTGSLCERQPDKPQTATAGLIVSTTPLTDMKRCGTSVTFTATPEFGNDKDVHECAPECLHGDVSLLCERMGVLYWLPYQPHQLLIG